MEKYKTATIFVLIGLVSLLAFTTGYFAISYQEQKDTTKAVRAKYRAEALKKISNKATSEQVLGLFQKKITFDKKPDVTVVWDFQGQVIEEDQFFAALGITKTSLKRDITNRWFKGGAKRFTQTCNQLYAPNNVWSLGYCTLEPYPKGSVS